MKNLLKEFKQLSLWSMVLFISFVTNSCDENNNLATESVNKTETYTEKADLNELINKIGDRDLKLIELIKNNPVSMIKTASYQKTKTSSSEYYFDTDNIMALKDNNNQAVYMIPAYKSSNTRDNNIYSISINITKDFIDTKLIILQLKEDGKQEFISRNFDPFKTNSKTSKTNDIECYCTIYITGGISQATGWDMPEEIYMECGGCSGGTSSGGSSSGSDFGTTSGSNAGPTVISNVWASSGGGSNYGYAYISTGQKAYIELSKRFRLDDLTPYNFTQFQQVAITSNLEISKDLIEFLDTDGKTQSNKFFVISILDGIENSTVNSYEEFRVLLNAYKQAQEFLAFKNNYFAEHPNTTAAQFENWFATPLEGKDTTYNPAFWDDPNLTFPKQDLPTRLNYLAGMPKFSNGDLMTGADNVYNLVGGPVLAARVADRTRTENTCALKTSIALNRSGVIIPNIPGETIEGAGPEFAGKYFFLNAKKLNVWMRETFGTNPATTKTPYNAKHLSLTATDGGLKGKNFPTLPALQNVSGIYSLVFKNNEASGHADYIYTDFDGKIRCPFGCFFNYEFERMDIWILD